MSCCQGITNQGSVNSDQIFYRVSSLRIRNVTLNSPLNASYTLTLPLDAGSANQVLTTDGVGNLFWISGSTIPGAGTVTSVSATVPSFLTVNVTNPTTLPQIQIGGSSTGTGSVVLSNAPTFTGTVTLGAQTNGTAAAFLNMVLSNPLSTSSGGTGLNSVGSANQILLSNGTNYVLTSSTGTGTNVLSVAPTFTGTVTLGSQTNGTAAAFVNMALSNPLPTGSGGSGLSTIGTNGQVLTSNGTALLWQTPTGGGGSVTSVSATVPSFLTVNVTNPTTLPQIQIGGSSTGTGAVVLSDAPTFTGTVTLGAQTNGTAAAFVNMALSNPLPTGSGGTGLSTIGTNGQVLISNGTSLLWQTPTGGGGGSDIGVATGTSLALTSNLTLSSGGKIRVNDGANNRKVVLFGDVNDFEYSGFGTIGGNLLYNCFTSADNHVFNSGASTTTFLELLRLKGNGLVNIPGLTASRTVATNGSKDLISVENTGTGNYVLQNNATLVNPILNSPTLVNPILGNATYTTLDAGTLLGKRRVVTYSATTNDEQFNGIGTTSNGQTYQVDNTTASHIFYAATSSTTSNELFRVKGSGGFTSAGDSEMSANLSVLGKFFGSNITTYKMSANSPWNNNSNSASPSNWQVDNNTGAALTNISGGTFQNATGVRCFVTVTWTTKRTTNFLGRNVLYIVRGPNDFGLVASGGGDWTSTTTTFELVNDLSFTLIGFQDSGSNVEFQAVNSSLSIRIDFY